MFKKSLAWLLTILMIVSMLPMSVFATEDSGSESSATINGIVYTVANGSASITDGKSAEGDVVIPEKVTIGGTEYPVVSVGGNAFNDANEVTSIVVPNSVTSLGGAAFANMDKLESITIGNGVTSWGSKLAVNNYELETVVIAEGATLIGDIAFRTCPKLANVTLPSTLKSIGATAFSGSAITELDIPASVEKIGSDAFKDIDTLKKVTFNSVPTSFGTTVFQMCDGLEEVVLPEGLKVIPQGTFRYCTSLKTINFPASLTEIGNYSFQGCTSLESVTISKNITKLVTNAFNGCTSLKNLTIEEGFAGTVGAYVFQGCTALESVVIPSSMETVGESMFNMCSNLKSVTLSEGVKTLNLSAFANCSSLTSITLPDSLERIRHGSFANCTALKSIIIVGENIPVIEHSNALEGISEDIVIFYTGDDEFTGNWASVADKVVDADKDSVAIVGDQGYATLKEAITAAKAIEGGATVTLLKDVTLGEKLTISGNVTIAGAYTITRADNYKGTLFTVNAGATLTLDGGLVIDGANEWTFNEELYNKALNLEVEGVTWADLITSEENAPEATAPMFLVNGSVVANKVTIQNNYSSESSNNGDYGVFKVEANATLTMTGATVKHIVTGGANSVAHLSTNAVWTINDGTLITDTFAGKNGGVCRNDSGKLVMNGGEISNNNSINTNGTVVMLYKGSMELNGGKICSNTGISGTANGRCAPIYGHSSSTFIMTGGEVCHNTGISYGGVDVPSSIKVEISGGYVGENISALGGDLADINGNANTVITGGTFTQDVSAWLAPDCGLVYDEEKGEYTTTEDVYRLWFRDPTTGEQLSYVGPLYGNDPASLVATGKLFYADYYVMELELLCDAKIDEPIVIDYPMTVNLNGHTLTGDNVYPVIRVQGGAEVTVKNGNINNEDYVFVLGASDGSSAGYLTIESGTYHGDTTVASVTKGTLTINGGSFSVDPYVAYEGADLNYNYLLNCVDANYKNGSASIVVNGGSFYKFNPADNAAEGAGTSFVTEAYLAEADGDYYTVRQNKDKLNSIVDIVITLDGGNTITLKYPSERFNSIQHIIGTNDYADFVLGADQNEMLASVANGNVESIVMNLYSDIELDAPINFYNKYFSIPVQYAITVNGNGNTITWADGYTGTLFNIESGVTVEMKNLTIDGENAFTFYNDTTTVENGQNWYTRFVNVGEEDKAVNANVIVNAGNLTLGEGTKIQNVTIASDSGNGKTSNTETGYNLMYNDDLALIKSNGGTVTLNGANISGNAGLVLNAINADTTLTNATIDGNMGCGNKGGIIIANGGKMTIDGGSISGNKAMARSATILGVINGAEVKFNSTMENNKHIGVGSNTAGAMIVLEGASQFVMNGGSISDNVGGRAGAIASRWVGGNYGQHADTSIILNAGKITDNSASNSSWSDASVFLRSPAIIGEGMTIEGTIAVNAAPGALEITGGNFTDFDLVVTDGLKAEISGGAFDADPSEWCIEGYVAPYDEATKTYSVRKQNYVEWVKAELLAGNSVTLTEDIVITDYDLVNALILPSNGNGKYGVAHGNGAVFHITKPGVVLDLAGHSIIWDAHDDAYCNKRQVSLFMVTATGVEGETADFTVKDSVGTGKVDVYGMASGMYVVCVGAKGTIEGGTWTNHPCKTCGASNIFIYPSHGGTLAITGGTFEQKNSDYLLGMKGSTKETTNNGVGVDYDATKVEITGGTFIGMNPGEIKFFDQANGSAETKADGCANGYAPKDNGDGTYGVQNAVKLHLTDPTTGKPATIPYLEGTDIASTVATGKLFYAGYYDIKLEILNDFETSEPIVIDYPMTIDLNGYTLNGGDNVYPVIRVQGDAKVTVKNGNINNEDYVFVLGASDGSSAGYLTIESGTYHGDTTVASVTKGTLTVNGGTFSVDPYEGSYEYTLNCVDANYKNESASIVVNGGTFYKFNPAKNAAEGAGTNFCAKNYTADDADEDGYYTLELADTFEIWTKEDLYKFASLVSECNYFEGKTIRLMADLDLEWAEWTPVSIYGTFDGGNHTIKNVTYVATSKGYMGFLQNVSGPVKNLTIDGVKGTVSANGRFGGFARSINSNVENIHVKNIEITSTSADVGGFAAYHNAGVIKNCSVTNFNVNSTTTVNQTLIAGFVANSYGSHTYNNCDVNGFTVVSASPSVWAEIGGLIAQTNTGHALTTITGCDVTGINMKVSGYAMAGGMVAVPGAHTHITNSTTEGTINAVDALGGFAGGFLGDLGWNNNESNRGGHVITNCSADVDVITKLVPAGGFVGSATNFNGKAMPAAFENCSATGTVTVADGGTASIGGFAGDADRGTYTNCTAAQEPFIGTVVEGSTLTNNNSYVASVDNTYYATFVSALAAAKESTSKQIILLAPVVITEDTTLDLTGITVDGNGVYPAFRIQNGANVTVEGGKVTNSDYVFVLGASDGSSAGYLTIESGTYHGDTTVASVTKGTLTVNGGEFSVAPYEGSYEYTLNCVDANYKNKSASIVVNGGTFYKFNPAKNAAEGADTNFVSKGFDVTEDGDNWTVVVKLPEIEIIDRKPSLKDSDPDLTFALNFSIKDIDELSQPYIDELFAKYGSYYVDYTLKIEGLAEDDVTFNADGSADGYLAGQYDAFGADWVTVPFEDVTIKNGESIKIMKYASESLNQPGLRFTLTGIAEVVQNFDCGVYFTPEFLAANPELKVTLYLDVFTEDADGNVDHSIPAAKNVFDLSEIAAIVTGEGKQSKYFATFAEAYAAAEDDDTIDLLKDVLCSGEVAISKSITIDGNGYNFIADEKYNGWYTTNKYGIKTYKVYPLAIKADNVVLKDVTIDCKKLGKGLDILGFSNIVLDNVTVKNETGNAININGSNVVLRNKITSNNLIGGGTNYSIIAENGVILDVKTVAFQGTPNYSNTNLDNALSTDGTSYFTFKKLDSSNNLAGYSNKIERLSNGYSWQLLEDGSVTSEIVILNAEHTGTLDLNGHTITVADGKALSIKGDLTIKGEGTVTGKFVLASANATLTAPAGLDVTAADENNYDVVYADGVYSLEEIKKVAQIGETTYPTLADAIANATAGDTITFLADINENVTVNKNLTIDGAEFKYTGTMTLGTVTATIQNVKFVSGEIVKTAKPVTGTFNIVNCSFEGNTPSGYALKIGNATTLNIENCTSKDNSFLYVIYSIANLSVKNVEIDNANWAFHLVSIERPVFENVTITNSACGIVVQNTGNKVITLKNCAIDAIEPLVIWEKQTNNVTFNFVGANDFGTHDAVWAIANNNYVQDPGSQYAVLNLNGKDYTLTAASGLNISTNVADYEVVYAEGVYSLAEIKKVAQIGDTQYNSLAAAIDAAVDGDTIVLIDNIELTDEVINIAKSVNITLDLNGYTITGTVTKTTTAFVYVTGCELTILDSTETAEGGIHAVNTNGNLSNLIRVETDAKLVIKSGNFSQDASTNGSGMIDSRGDEIITIEGGNFRLYNIGSASNGSPWIFNASSQNEKNIIVNGGTFNADIIHQYYPFEVMAPREKALVKDADGIWYFVDAVAYVNEQEWSSAWYTNEVGYATLEAALAACEDVRTKSGQTSAEEFVSIIGTLTINDAVANENNRKITGTVVLGNVSASLTAPKNDALTVTSGVSGYDVVYENGAYKLVKLAVAKIGDTTYPTLADAVAAAKDGDTIVLLKDTTANGVTIGYSNAVAITIDLNGHTVSSTDKVLNVFRINTVVTLTNGTVSGNSTGGTVNVTYNGKLILGDNITITSGGQANAINLNTGKLEVAQGAHNVVVSGGIGSINTQGDTENTITIGAGYYEGDLVINASSTCTLTGGTFTMDVNAYCAEGYYAKNNGDGTWTVVKLFNIAGANMNLGNSLDMNFFIKKSDIIEGREYYLTITKSYADGRENLVITVPQSEWNFATKQNMYYVTFEGLAAKEMSDIIYVQVFDAATNEAVSTLHTDSVRLYAERMLPKATSDKEKTLYVDMLNYGAGAQVFYKYNNVEANLANANIADYQSFATVYEDGDYTNNQVKGNEYYIGTSLVLKNTLVVAFAFNDDIITDDSYAIVTFTDHRNNEYEIRIEAADFVVQQSVSGVKFVYVDTPRVADGRQLITCKLYDNAGNEISSASDNVESYVARNVAKYPFYELILKFSDAAYDYLHRNDK